MKLEITEVNEEPQLTRNSLLEFMRKKESFFTQF